MTGKLDLNLGDYYEFNPRRARQVAEGRELLADSTVIDGGNVPITGVLSGSQWEMSWFADGVSISVTHTAPGVQTKSEVLAALAGLGAGDATVSASDSNTEIVVLLSAGPELSAGVIQSVGTGQIGVDPLPPGGVDGPNSSVYGQPYWIQHTNSGRWYVAWDVDADPDPDVRKALRKFLRDEGTDQLYRNDVEARARALGWRG